MFTTHSSSPAYARSWIADVARGVRGAGHEARVVPLGRLEPGEHRRLVLEDLHLRLRADREVAGPSTAMPIGLGNARKWVLSASPSARTHDHPAALVRR